MCTAPRLRPLGAENTHFFFPRTERRPAQRLLDAGSLAEAIERCGEALCLASESPPALLPLHTLLAACLGREGRHVEALAVCDRGLALVQPERAAATPSAVSAPTERERLLLRRAGSFTALGQHARALSDYRSAAALHPMSTAAAAGVRGAWEALQEAADPTAGADPLPGSRRESQCEWC